MSAKKFERLIDLILNEDQEKAEALFHDIVVEKSRQIYESMMDDQSGSLMDEIESEDTGMSGMMEDDEDMGDDMGGDDMGDDMGDMGDDADFESEEDFDDSDEFGDEEGDEEGEEELEDRVIDLEDKLDQLMAEFESKMGGDDSEEEGDDSEEEDFGDEEGEEEDGILESIELKKVSVTHGDNGAQTKSAVAANSGARGMASKPVKFAGDTETVPTSAARPSNPYAKGEQKMSTTMKNTDRSYDFKERGESAPKPVTTKTASKSPVAESKRTAKRRV